MPLDPVLAQVMLSTLTKHYPQFMPRWGEGKRGSLPEGFSRITLEILPHEIILHTLSYLDTLTVASMNLVSKKFHIFAEEFLCRDTNVIYQRCLSYVTKSVSKLQRDEEKTIWKLLDGACSERYKYIKSQIQLSDLRLFLGNGSIFASWIREEKEKREEGERDNKRPKNDLEKLSSSVALDRFVAELHRLAQMVDLKRIKEKKKREGEKAKIEAEYCLVGRFGEPVNVQVSWEFKIGFFYMRPTELHLVVGRYGSVKLSNYDYNIGAFSSCFGIGIAVQHLMKLLQTTLNPQQLVRFLLVITLPHCRRGEHTDSSNDKETAQYSPHHFIEDSVWKSITETISTYVNSAYWNQTPGILSIV